MRLVEKGDTIFSYYNQRLRHVGTVAGPAVDARKPINFDPDNQWDAHGWRVPVSWESAQSPLDPMEIIDDIRSYLPQKYSPLRHDGKGLQGVYLAAIPDVMGKILLDHMSAPKA